MTRTKRLRKWWNRRFLRYELRMALALAVGSICLILYFWDLSAISTFTKGQQIANLYRTTATVSAPLLGLTMATLAIMINASGKDRFTKLRISKSFETMWKVYQKTMRLLGIQMVWSIIALVVQPWLVGWLGVGHLCVGFYIVLLVVFRLGRAIWIVNEMMETLVVEAREERRRVLKEGGLAPPSQAVAT